MTVKFLSILNDFPHAPRLDFLTASKSSILSEIKLKARKKLQDNNTETISLHDLLPVKLRKLQFQKKYFLLRMSKYNYITINEFSK